MVVEEDNAPDTYIKESLVNGYGLFALNNFKKHDTIIDYNLFPTSWKKISYKLLTKQQINNCRFVALNNTHCLVSKTISKFGYINHSKNPNCLCLFSERKVVALKNIKKDTELFINYQLEFDLGGLKYPEWI